MGAWHPRMHNEYEWPQQLQSRSILYGRRCHNYDHGQRIHGWKEREGGMIAWAAAALSGLLLLICCIQSDRNYSPSHSNIYENSYFFYQNLCAFHARHVHAGGPKLEPLPVPPTAPLSPHSHSLSFSRQWPLAIIRRNKRQLTESN